MMQTALLLSDDIFSILSSPFRDKLKYGEENR